MELLEFDPKFRKAVGRSIISVLVLTLENESLMAKFLRILFFVA